MKIIEILAIVWFLPFVGFCASPSEELQEAVKEAGIKARPPVPSASDTLFDPRYLVDLDELPAAPRERLALKLARITPLIAAEWQDGRNRESNSPLVSIVMLGHIANDEQKVEAFKNLDLYGRMLADAAHVLATCEGVKGVRILKQYATNQLTKVETLLVDAKNRSTRQPEEDNEISFTRFCVAVIALQGAYHSSGPTAAEKLRDKLFKAYENFGNQELLVQVSEQFEKEMGKASARREKSIREKEPERRRRPERVSIETEVPEKSSSLSSLWDTSTRLLWLGTSIAGGVVFLLFAGWFVFKRKHSRTIEK